MKRTVKDCLDSYVTVKGSATGWIGENYVQMDVPLRYVLNELTNMYKYKVEQVRSLPYHSIEQKKVKEELPFFYIGGTFPIKNIKDSSIITPSNLMCIDIDFCDNEKEPSEYRELLFNLPWVLGCYLSASGKGIYLIVPIKDSTNPKPYYKYIEKLLLTKFNVKVDSNAINTARARVLSYDDINTWTKPETDEIKVFDMTLQEKQNNVVKNEVKSYSKYAQKQNAIDDLLQDDDFCYKAADYAINKLGMQTNVGNNMRDWLGHISTLTLLGSRGLQLAIDLSKQSSEFKSEKDVTNTFNRYSRRNADRTYMLRYFKYCKDKLGKDWIKTVKNEQPLLFLS